MKALAVVSLLAVHFGCASSQPRDERAAMGEDPCEASDEPSRADHYLGAYRGNSAAGDHFELRQPAGSSWLEFVYAPHPDAGLGEGVSFRGIARDEGEALHLVCDELEALGWAPPTIGPYMLPVRWCQRRYLVPKNQVVEFCNSVNGGFEVGDTPLSPFLLREKDLGYDAPVGPPTLPEFYADYVLSEPLSADVLDVRRQEESDRTWVVTVNAGRAHGLLPGMELHVDDAERGDIPSMRVLRAHRRHAEALIYEPPAGLELPRVGWRVSTRSPFGGGATPGTGTSSPAAAPVFP